MFSKRASSKQYFTSHLSYDDLKKSLCLVHKDEKTKNLILNKEALDLIQNVNGEICVCSIIGQYRSGKSFLLNNMFKKLRNSNHNPFGVDHQEDSFTKGCWIPNELPQIKNKHGNNVNVLFIDTEGLESENNDEQWDTNLFLFNLLISSMFIYNTKSNLSADDFKKLAVMSNLSNRIKLHARSSKAENEKKLREEGPHFVCIVRDFHLAKEKYTAKESLQRFLDFEEEDDDDVASKHNKETAMTRNEIRKNMINTFREFDCFRIPKPVSDDTIKGKYMEEALQMLDQIEYEKLREKFKEEFDQMIEWFMDNLRPKCVKNTNINGRVLCEFMKSIVDSINNNQIIKLHDTLIEAIKAGFDQQFEMIKKDYSNFISSIRIPIKSFDLNEKNNTKCNELKTRMKNEIINFNLYSEYEAKLNEFMSLKFKEIKEKNAKEIESYNKGKTVEVWNREYSSKISSFETVSQFESLLNTFKSEFKSKYQFELNNNIENSLWYDFESKIETSIKRNELRQKEDDKKQKELEAERQRQQAVKSSAFSNCSYPNNYFRQFELSAPNYPSNSGLDSCKDKVVGIYESNGSANGREVYEGPRGGLYRLTKSGKKEYVSSSDVDFD